MVKLYLNIDGVLLTKDQNQLAEHATEFIDFVVNHFDCYWLTTHCHGDVQEVMELLSECLDLDSLENIKKIKPTKWNILKTEAINIKDDFYWLDDSPLQTEIIFLKKNKVIDRLITVNLNHEGELNKILNDPLKKIINNTLLKENSTKDNIFKKTVFKNDNFEITLKLNILKGKVEDMPEGKDGQDGFINHLPPN